MTQNKFDTLDASPPPLFVNQKERDFVKQISDETIERIIGQVVVYYPIDLEKTNVHPLYGESLKKTFLSPIKINCLIEWTSNPTSTTNYGVDQTSEITVHFHHRRLTEDQDLYVKSGDFILYGKDYYEILQTWEPRELFGQAPHKVEVSAKCIKARQDLFDGT